MHPQSWFADLNEKEKQVIVSYSDVEILFVASKDFYSSAENIFFRRLAVAMISQLAKTIDPDTLIPYLAMNYFDRFFSKRNSILEEVEGYFDNVKVRLIAIACFTIAAKMRIKDFSIEQFLITHYRIVNLRISHHMVMRTELLILRELLWEMLPVTPFIFLNFYYRFFKKYGGFKRRCINEIIVQAQGEHTFVDYYPTMIAMSALLAASRIAYGRLYREIVIPFTIDKVVPLALQDKVFVCVDEMVDLCNRLNIQIETPESRTPSTSELTESQQNFDTPEFGTPYTSELQESQQSIDTPELGTPSTSELKESQQNKGKAAMVYDSSKEEDDDEEDDTAFMRFLQDMGERTKTSRALKISENVEGENKKLEKGETSGGGYKAKIECIIRQPLEKGKAVAGEKMEGYISEIAELEELKSLMNFELKWSEIVPSTEPQSQTVNRSKSKGKFLRTAKKLSRRDCKTGNFAFLSKIVENWYILEKYIALLPKILELSVKKYRYFGPGLEYYHGHKLLINNLVL
ncbi:uncharacterized protein LOC131651128 [Vicia villosa]|uniref:uncharacterized protein LOC131651128 n=1 Tax=Vicia villosa TaxID=3911 RepID=UPI00273A756A|nr:uncharacterized protein LOC131651128 [Vicia villosa]